MNKGVFNGLLIMALLALIAVPILFMPGTTFTGTDDKALKVIAQTAPGYKPWLNNLWKPVGGTEALIFTLQAAIGSFVLGYILGLLRGENKGTSNAGDKNVQN